MKRQPIIGQQRQLLSTNTTTTSTIESSSDTHNNSNNHQRNARIPKTNKKKRKTLIGVLVIPCVSTFVFVFSLVPFWFSFRQNHTANNNNSNNHNNNNNNNNNTTTITRKTTTLKWKQQQQKQIHNIARRQRALPELKDDDLSTLDQQQQNHDSSKNNAKNGSTPKEETSRQAMERHQELNEFYKESTANAQKILSASISLATSLSALEETKNYIPEWIRIYLTWHIHMRELYPDTTLLAKDVAPDGTMVSIVKNNNDNTTLPKPPNILIKVCTKQCGGLYDRLGTFHEVLYTAYRLKRVVLFKWFLPLPLETFLLPHSINFTVPQLERFKFKHMVNTTINSNFLDGWKTRFQKRYSHTLEYAEKENNSNNSTHGDVMVLKFCGKPCADTTQELLQAGESVELFEQSFGTLWNLFFQPSPSVQTTIHQTYQSLGFDTNNNNNSSDEKYSYDAVHCRVRHPGRFPSDQNMDGIKPGTSADVSGLPWKSNVHAQEMAIQTGIHAVQCAQVLATMKTTTSNNDSKTQPTDIHNNDNNNDDDDNNNNNNNNNTKLLPIYFFSDSEDLVQYMTQPVEKILTMGNTSTTVSSERNNGTQTLTELDQMLFDIKSFKDQRTLSQTIVSRDVRRIPAVHLDRQQGKGSRSTSAYQATFVDLYLAINARCITFGVGNFAYLAAKISGTDCLMRHEEFHNMDNNNNNNNTSKTGKDGNWFNQQTGGAPLCPLPPISSSG